MGTVAEEIRHQYEETCGTDAVGPRKLGLHLLGQETEGCSDMILSDRSCQENILLSHTRSDFKSV